MNWPEGYGRRVFASVDSTLSEAVRLAPDLRGPMWILALEQTSGRGRRGRAWSMPKGYFAATLVMPVTEEPGVVALRSFVMSLALYDAFRAAGVEEARLALKWPNDVLLSGGKVAGILLESGPHPSGGLWMAVGIGVNLAIAPPVHGRRVTALADHASTLTPEAGLTRLVDAFERYRRRWEVDGFDPIRTAWLSRAWGLGESCRASVNGVTVTGVFTDLLGNGALQLSLADGSSKTVSAGEVFFSDQE